MRLNTKKMMATLGILLFIGASAITTQAYTTCSFSTTNGEVTAHASGNINTSVFTYAGFCTEANYTKYVPARMKVCRAFYSKVHEQWDLTTKVYTNQKITAKKDAEGIRIDLMTYDTDGITKTSSESRIIRCD